MNADISSELCTVTQSRSGCRSRNSDTRSASSSHPRVSRYRCRSSQTGLSPTLVRIHSTSRAGTPPIQNTTRQPSVDAGDALNGSGTALKSG